MAEMAVGRQVESDGPVDVYDMAALAEGLAVAAVGIDWTGAARSLRTSSFHAFERRSDSVETVRMVAERRLRILIRSHPLSFCTMKRIMGALLFQSSEGEPP